MSRFWEIVKEMLEHTHGTLVKEIAETRQPICENGWTI